MDLNYIYTFEKHGMLAPVSGALENEVWIDVGNTLGMGLFDHHQGGEGSAFSTVLLNTKYLKKLKKSAVEGKDIHVHMHEAPDMDCISSLWFIKKFLELSKDEFDLFCSSKVVEKFREYVDSIDEGKGKETSYPTLYAIFSNIGENSDKDLQNTYKTIVERGLELLAIAEDKLKEDSDTDLFTYDFGRECRDLFGEEIHDISDSEYKREKTENKIDFCKIELWNKDNELVPVEAAIWKEESRGSNGYSFARKEGCVLTVVPSFCLDKEKTFTRVFASINPEKDPERNYTLKPIAEIIEQMEQVEEKALFQKEGRYRRDYSKPRDTSGHFSKNPFAVTSNPWCISEAEDFFDAPYGYSLLDYRDILEVIKNNGSSVKKSFAISYKWDEDRSVSKPDYARYRIPLNLWEDTVRIWKDPENASDDREKDDYSGISENGARIIYAELDSSLLRHSNEMLKAICMNIVGGTYHECRDDEFLFLNYRTCIYADLNYVVILVATSSKEDQEKDLPSDENTGNSLDRYIDTKDNDKFMASPLIQDILRLMDFRNSILFVGGQVGDVDISDRKAIEKLNKKMLQLSIEHQRDGIKNNYIEKSVYDFLLNRYEIDSLKSSIMEEVSVLTGEARDRMVSKFNVLSAFAVPFILIATIFQIGIIKFQEVVSLTGTKALLGWCFVIVLIAVIIYLLGRNK